jgi:hypothetical protein
MNLRYMNWFTREGMLIDHSQNIENGFLLTSTRFLPIFVQ